jgi:hypothetical protein
MFFDFHNGKSVRNISNSDLEDYNTPYILANGFSHTYKNQTIYEKELFGHKTIIFSGRGLSNARYISTIEFKHP